MQAKFNGQKVRTLRKMKKLSQAMLAEQGDTSERYIRDLERGQKRNPSARWCAASAGRWALPQWMS